jgi:hypothetical protein
MAQRSSKRMQHIENVVTIAENSPPSYLRTDVMANRAKETCCPLTRQNVFILSTEG